MQTSKITQFFKKVPSKDSDAARETSGANSIRDSTALLSVNHNTSEAEVSLSQSALSPQARDKSNAAQAILIESDTSEDEEKLQGANPLHKKNANRSKAIILDEETDSETTMENLSIRSPQKRRRLILDDDDEDASAGDIGASTKTAEEAQDSLSHGEDQVTESGGEGCMNIPSKRRLVRKRSETQHREEDYDNAAICLDIFSDSQKSSDEEEIQLTRKTRKKNVIRDNEEDESDEEDWDVDKSAILEERTRIKKQSRYSEMLAVRKAGKQRMNEYSNDIPVGPLDRFTFTPHQSGAAPNEEDFLNDTDDDHEHVESQNHDTEDDDGFVVADDIIDGVHIALSQQETHELPDEFSTRYQNNTEGYFHVYFEYLMYCIVDPAYGHADNIDTRFKVAISAVNRLIDTCKDKVHSPVWKKHFTEDLEAWPSADWKPIYQPNHDCDACMILGKGSTSSLTLFGSRYDEHCFPIQYEEPVQSSANLENVDSPNINHWLGYQKDRPRKDRYWVGSTCFNRARIYHALVHLKFDLCTEIREFVRSVSNDYGSQASQSSQHRNIDNLVDIMVETRLTDKLWSLAKERVNDALHLRSDRAFKRGMDVSSFFKD
ncbi:hypothetical protein K450DRAFT_239904 [Umbelopsis ramanniana AG]|uniref:DUF4211 domain-containing protein n=1 Tax=Umbelopsis ramanniana AG TaxID=1314678 RepID=A0AAD5EAW3_UMBRA|nr:uncharacterized protein K450DRAFT_239904 [Umbelopsis ramanniana AG]KAI8579957.1 hypothetical protein K450DRAFT_239904 [Umbelopsis ramanniana AG]